MEGLVLRPYAGESDIVDIVRIANAEFSADGVPGHESIEDQLPVFRNPSEQFDPARDVTLAEVDGRVVGYGRRSWADVHDSAVRDYRVNGAVEPGWRRHGIGTALLAENERRQRELAATHDTPRTKVFGSFTGQSQPARVALLRGAGYQEVRWFFDMTRPTLDDVPDAALPDGLEVRPITPDMIRAVWDADNEAFRDHWGGGDTSDEALKRWIESPNHDARLWVVAYEGDQVAAGVINGIYPEENEALGLRRGWLDSVFTRRPWRRRGLARALICRSLHLLRERGMTSAVLGVDADNPTGALGLYESVGFEVSYRSTAWRKPLKAGV